MYHYQKKIAEEVSKYTLKPTELKEAQAKDIVKGITDMDGPFTVVAIKNNKVIKQEGTKMRDALPAIVKMMRKEVGSGVTISIEGKKGILNTFKEEVENVEEGVRMMAGAEKMVKDDPIGGSSMVSSLRAAKKSLEGKPTGSVLVVTKEKSPESMSIKVYAPSDFASLTKGLTKKPEAKVGSKGSWSGGEVTVVAIKEAVEVTEGGVKDALADYLHSIPKKAIEELKPVMKIKNLTQRFAMITKVLKKHGFNDKFMGSFPSNVVNDYYDTFFGESVEEGRESALTTVGYALVVDNKIVYRGSKQQCLKKAKQYGGLKLGKVSIALTPKNIGQLFRKEEVEVNEVATPEQQKKNAYAEREAQAKEIAKKILQVAKERGVRVYTDGSRVVSATKDFPKGDVGAFNKAYNDCGMVLTHMRFTKNGNQWGCSSAGFGVGAQECVKAGRAQQHKSGDGGSLIIKFLKV